MAGFLNEDRPIRTLREILTRLRETYCGSIGYEVTGGGAGAGAGAAHAAHSVRGGVAWLHASCAAASGCKARAAAGSSSMPRGVLVRRVPPCALRVHAGNSCLTRSGRPAPPCACLRPRTCRHRCALLPCCCQYMHIPDRDRCNWLRERIETPQLVRSLSACWQQQQQQAYTSARCSCAVCCAAGPDSHAGPALCACRPARACPLPLAAPARRSRSRSRRSCTHWTASHGATCLRPSSPTSEAGRAAAALSGIALLLLLHRVQCVRCMRRLAHLRVGWWPRHASKQDACVRMRMLLAGMRARRLAFVQRRSPAAASYALVISSFV